MTLSRDHVTSCSALASAMASISVAVLGPTPPVVSSAIGSCTKRCRDDKCAYFLFFVVSFDLAVASLLAPFVFRVPGAGVVDSAAVCEVAGSLG